MPMDISIRISNNLNRSRLKPRNIDTQTTMNLQPASRLFSLPVEIRLQIYELLLLLYDATPALVPMPTKNRVSILQTCRRVLHEADQIYYSIHYFGFGPDFGQILRAIGPHRRNALTALTVWTSSGSAAYGIIKQLHALPNLKICTFQQGLWVRDLNMSDWSLMAQRLQAELTKLGQLREAMATTPEASGYYMDLKQKRKQKLREVDAILERG
ncbi:hypothetical protein LTR37_006565 [Vermiconidia calcicola]|uniref:Uncharacterized protein n=1 Tax=Vermiconidia calcicola TaxID=1690605 RepID=A0ACC3NH03_9PEZI|nr:hypothetical protein LTR37_006565 [Vermiconidia calcicola]